MEFEVDLDQKFVKLRIGDAGMSITRPQGEIELR